MSAATKDTLTERRDQLIRDIDNYEHMLEEANDLKKAWDKSDSDMVGIRQDDNFQDMASIFESTVDVSSDSTEANHSTFKAINDRVTFDNLVSVCVATECTLHKFKTYLKKILMIWVTF